MNLIYSYMTAGFDCNEDRHAQEVMRELGITYHHAIPQSLGDCWQFFDCKNLPKKLPKYLTELKFITTQEGLK